LPYPTTSHARKSQRFTQYPTNKTTVHPTQNHSSETELETNPSATQRKYSVNYAFSRLSDLERSRKAPQDDGMKHLYRIFTTQRDLSIRLNISLGKTDYLLRELILKGFIKVKNFTGNPGKPGKINYFY